jgi:hypothetical protein
MTDQNLPPEFLELLKNIKGKRSKIVIEHILEHGFITTEDLEQLYGYKHPPRAVRDVREQGVPVESFSVKNSKGLTISAYRFGDFREARQDKLKGRRVIPKAFKQQLIEINQSKCTVCSGNFEARYFQVDHRIPYEVTGDAETRWSIDEFMLLCASCNRAKSWSCEHCPNWQIEKSVEICSTCYWANPTHYNHLAMLPIRRLDIIWEGSEAKIFDEIRQQATDAGKSMSDYVKILLERQFKQGE